MKIEELEEIKRKLALRPTEDETEYWYNFFDNLFSLYEKNPNPFDYNHVVPKKNENWVSFQERYLYVELDKEKIVNYFKGRIPDDKISFEFTLFEKKYLTFVIKILLSDNNEIILKLKLLKNVWDGSIIESLTINYSRIIPTVYLSGYTKKEFFFDKLIDIYCNYDEYLKKYLEYKKEGEKDKKLTSINTISAEPVANLYFDDYSLEINDGKICLIINISDNLHLKYLVDCRNIADSFKSIKENLNKVLALFNSFSEDYISIKMEKYNDNQLIHKGLVAKEKLQDLLKDEAQLRKQITDYVRPKIVMKGKRPFIYSESHLMTYFLNEKNIAIKIYGAENEEKKLKTLFEEICKEEKEKMKTI